MRGHVNSGTKVLNPSIMIGTKKKKGVKQGIKACTNN